MAIGDGCWTGWTGEWEKQLSNKENQTGLNLVNLGGAMKTSTYGENNECVFPLKVEKSLLLVVSVSTILFYNFMEVQYEFTGVYF